MLVKIRLINSLSFHFQLNILYKKHMQNAQAYNLSYKPHNSVREMSHVVLIVRFCNNVPIPQLKHSY